MMSAVLSEGSFRGTVNYINLHLGSKVTKQKGDSAMSPLDGTYRQGPDLVFHQTRLLRMGFGI